MSSEMMRKYIDIINEQETLNEEMLEEGMLQKLAGLALGTVLALGPKIGQADTIYSYLPANSQQMQTATDYNQIPKDAKAIFEIDTDTNSVHAIKANYFSKRPTKGQEIQPDPAAVKQGQQGQAQVTQQPQAQQPQAQQPQTQPSTIQNSDLSQYSVKGIRFGMTKKELSKVADVRLFGILTSIGGVSNWTPKYENDKLVDLHSFPESDNMEEILETFTKAYGAPKIERFTSRTKGGLELSDFRAEWKIKDAVITMNKHLDRDTGYVGIEQESYHNKQSQARQAERDKNAGDF